MGVKAVHGRDRPPSSVKTPVLGSGADQAVLQDRTRNIFSELGIFPRSVQRSRQVRLDYVTCYDGADSLVS
jgi:hypothetical protein